MAIKKASVSSQHNGPCGATSVHLCAFCKLDFQINKNFSITNLSVKNTRSYCCEGKPALESEVRGHSSCTLMPLMPWGPLGADIMDPSAAMVTPGSPFSPYQS